MSIQNFLLDTIKQCNIAKISVLKVSPHEGVTRVQSYDDDRVLFIDAFTHEAVEEVSGEFGLFNFKILKGLLTMTNFLTDEATIKVGSRKDGTVPDRIDFKGGGSKATFRLMNKEVVPEQPTIVNIPWDISFTPQAAKIAEFQQIASLYNDVEGLFSLRTDGTDLVADFGNDSASTHSASMVLEHGVTGSIVGEMKFPIDKFLILMKTSMGAKSCEIKITSKGLLGVEAVTEYATYNYYVKKTA